MREGLSYLYNVYVLGLEVARAIEAVGAKLAFGQANGFDEGLQCVELQRGEVESFTNLLYQALILGCACC